MYFVHVHVQVVQCRACKSLHIVYEHVCTSQECGCFTKASTNHVLSIIVFNPLGITVQRTQTCEDELRGTIQRKMRSMSLSSLTNKRVKQRPRVPGGYTFYNIVVLTICVSVPLNSCVQCTYMYMYFCKQINHLKYNIPQ